MTVLLTVTSYFVASVVVYYAVLFCVSLMRHGTANGELPTAYVIFVAALDEEAVIGQTVERLLQLDYPRFVVCVGDDGSTDATPKILARYSENPHVSVLRREHPRAQSGKSDVLNECMEHTMRMLDSEHPVLGGLDPAAVVVGIVDADGQLDRETLQAVGPYFGEARVASVQIGVRIANASTNLLTRMQDMEFVGFSAFVQRARDRVGSSGLGGNGQFTRLSALLDLKAARGGPWKVDALTEDLELGLALVCRGWRTRYCPTVYVAQQGLPGWRALFRQRTRWIQGHYRCWGYLPRLMGAPATLMTRLDLSLYLLLIVTVIVVSFNAVVATLMIAGVITTHNDFLSFLHAGSSRNAVSLTIGIAPLAMFMYVYQRNATKGYRPWEIPAAGLVFTLYTYVWIFATLRAFARNLTGRRNWVKTPRVAEPATLSSDQLQVTQ
ncbi:MAG: glycosyltransferase family 2 protein [Solirubrobacteraceae bacterium]|jgi:cellulose synthase/poly-beta-1,6-N-acetylglucosamine synthase-like glycosyltransferase